MQRSHRAWVAVVVASATAACSAPSATPPPEVPESASVTAPSAPLRDDREVHLADVRQLTRGMRENAEAYWSFDGTQLIFQSNRPPHECDQIFRMPADGSAEPVLVSTGAGRTTCGFFLPGDRRVIWSSTHLAAPACPPAPDRSKGYVWPVYAGYDIFASDPDGGNVVRLTDTPGYDAEATVCPVDGSIVFTSVRDGDLELYRMNADGTGVVRLTNAPGYDGGAFFDRTCEHIVWRASRPTGAELDEYRALLAEGLVRPGKLELWVANADGSDARQVTYLGAASFGPYFYPSGHRILFSSNYGDPHGREFDLWAVDVAGTALERITYTPGFDGFPMFSPDGRLLVFGSNRNQLNRGETDIYVARWVDGPPRDVVERAPDRVMADIRWLADDAREGRGVGTRGLAEAADWIERRLRALGLDVQRQPVDVPVAVERGADTALRIDGAPVAAGAWTPSGASANGAASGRVVFANYGIVAPELGIDDYRRVRAKGRVVVVRRFAPKGGKFDDAAQRRYSDIQYKARVARDRGAVALVVVDLPPAGDDADEAPLPALAVARHGDAGLPVAFVSRAVGEALVRGRHRVDLRVDLRVRMARTHNVIARLPGPAGAAGPPVVVGAHYDHLGMGGEGSLAPDVRAPHNGADDNASGTAALLEVARELAARRERLGGDVWFVAFTAEEAGLVGSTRFVRSPPDGLAIERLAAMLNMDMVGRMRENRVQVLGGDSAEQWREIVPPACAARGVLCELGGDGYGPSDQTPFYAAGVPVLHFFTGAHSDYHKPSDDAGRINAAGTAQIAGLVADLVDTLSRRAEPLTYRRAPAPAPRGDVRSYGASLGTIPDYAGAPDGAPGVVLAGVRAGGPADRAGLRRGDRIVRIGDYDIANIYDLMHVLQQARPGQTTTVIVVRGDRKLTLRVTYGQRSRPAR